MNQNKFHLNFEEIDKIENKIDESNVIINDIKNTSSSRNNNLTYRLIHYFIINKINKLN